MIEAVLSAGVMFWVLFAVANILLLYWINREYSGVATLSLLVTGALLQWVCHIDIIGYVMLNPVVVGWFIGGYIVAGTFWAIAKWWFFVRAERRKYDEFKAVFLKSNDIVGNVIPDDLKSRFADQLRDRRYGEDAIEVRPDVTKHKARIYLWMIYFPWSMVWTIINDPVRRIFTEIYGQIRAMLQRISDHVWAGTDQDLPPRGQR